ncbi:MAG: carboxypeptidase regulatory-like domain-containing protein [Vicinamibacterales bacterium]
MARRDVFLATVLVLLFGSAAAHAQVQTGTILVRTFDEQGGAMPGVTVTATSGSIIAGQLEGVTDAGGVHRFLNLVPGTYSVRADLAGFQTLVLEGIVVSVGQTAPLDLRMRVAAIQETVTVSGQSPVIDTTSASVNVTITQELLQGTPGGRDIWSLMEYKVPGLVTNRPDVGGAAGGLQANFSARGTPSSQNVHFLNGVNITSPSAPGATNLYYDYDAFEEIQISTGAHDISVPSAGVFLNMVNRTGTDRFSGKAAVFWQGDATQGTNVDEELSRFGLRSDAGAVDYVSDASLQLGGPVVKNKLRFFGSFRDWRVNVNVPGFPEIEQTTITTGHGNASWQLNPNHRASGFVTRQYYKKPNRGANALFTPESTFSERNTFGLYQGLWNSVLSDRAFVDGRISYNDLVFNLHQKGRQQAIRDLSTGILERAALNQSLNGRQRLQFNATFNYYVQQALGGRHDLRFGIDHSHSPADTQITRIDDVNLTYRSQPTPAASTVQVFNSPVHTRQAVDVTTLFFQDSYVVRNLTVTGGVRFERLEAYLPEQNSPASPFFPNAQRRFEAVRDVLNWKNVAPRISIVYDLVGNGKTALKAAAGRYLYTVGTGEPNNGNPNFTSSETYVWSDLNRDLLFQPGEMGALLSRAGGSITVFDNGIVRPFTNELSASIDHELVPGLKLTGAFTYRTERDLYGSQDVGVPFSAFRPVTVRDIGRDGLAGTADDGTISVFDQDPATRGQNRFVIDNSAGLNQTYRGMEITAAKRFSDRWQMLAGYTASRSIINAVNVRNPNDLINSRGPGSFDRTHTFKLTGSYIFPYDIGVSGNFRTQSGLPVTRVATYGLTQGNVTVNVEPAGSVRLDRMTTVDLRVSKVFRMGPRDLELMLDAYNLGNVNTAYEVRTLTGRINVRESAIPTGALINQQQFLSPTAILPPRIFRLAASYRF